MSLPTRATRLEVETISLMVISCLGITFYVMMGHSSILYLCSSLQSRYSSSLY